MAILTLLCVLITQSQISSIAANKGETLRTFADKEDDDMLQDYSKILNPELGTNQLSDMYDDMQWRNRWINMMMKQQQKDTSSARRGLSNLASHDDEYQDLLDQGEGKGSIQGRNFEYSNDIGMAATKDNTVDSNDNSAVEKLDENMNTMFSTDVNALESSEKQKQGYLNDMTKLELQSDFKAKENSLEDKPEYPVILKRRENSISGADSAFENKLEKRETPFSSRWKLGDTSFLKEQKEVKNEERPKGLRLLNWGGKDANEQSHFMKWGKRKSDKMSSGGFSPQHFNNPAAREDLISTLKERIGSTYDKIAKQLHKEKSREGDKTKLERDEAQSRDTRNENKKDDQWVSWMQGHQLMSKKKRGQHLFSWH